MLFLSASAFFSLSYVAPRLLHSFPTRRSSDLVRCYHLNHLQQPVRLERLHHINHPAHVLASLEILRGATQDFKTGQDVGDRKSTRLNSSHRCISYAVFCLKKKKKITTDASVKN